MEWGFDRRLAVGGLAVSLVIALAGIGVTILWPDQKVLGWGLLWIAAGIFFLWICFEIIQSVGRNRKALLFVAFAACVLFGGMTYLSWRLSGKESAPTGVPEPGSPQGSPSLPPVSTQPPSQHHAPPSHLATGGPSQSAKPELLDFNSTIGATISNGSNQSILLLSMVASITSTFTSGDQSVSFRLNTEIAPHEAHNFSFSEIQGTFETMPKMDGGFQDQWRTAQREYAGCFYVVFFLPSSPSFKQIVDHYAATNLNLGVGDAQGTLTYKAKNSSTIQTEELPLRAILARLQGCKPTPQ